MVRKNRIYWFWLKSLSSPISSPFHLSPCILVSFLWHRHSFLQSSSVQYGTPSLFFVLFMPILYCAAPYCAVPYCAVPYCAAPYCAAPYCAVPYCICPALFCCVVLCCVVLPGGSVSFFNTMVWASSLCMYIYVRSLINHVS